MCDGHNAQTLSYNPSPTVLLYRISVLLRAVHSQRETHRVLQPQDRVQSSPLPRKPPHYVPRKEPLWRLRKELCFGAETLQTPGCYVLESLVVSAFSKNLQFCSFSEAASEAPGPFLSPECLPCSVIAKDSSSNREILCLSPLPLFILEVLRLPVYVH